MICKPKGAYKEERAPMSRPVGVLDTSYIYIDIFISSVCLWHNEVFLSFLSPLGPVVLEFLGPPHFAVSLALLLLPALFFCGSFSFFLACLFAWVSDTSSGHLGPKLGPTWG